MAGRTTRLLALGLTTGLAVGGCSLLDADPTRVTLGELISGAYDPDLVTGFDIEAMGLELEETSAFCEAVGAAPLRWTTDAPVPMQVWVDIFAGVADVPPSAQASVEQLLDFTQRRLRWSLTGEGDRPVWDSGTVEAAEALLDVAITTCPDLPLVAGFPGQSDRPPGWADLSDAEIADHCAAMAQRFESGVAEFEADHGRPPRHQLEMELPSAYYGTTDFHGLETAADGRPMVVPVPGGACDL